MIGSNLDVGQGHLILQSAAAYYQISRMYCILYVILIKLQTVIKIRKHKIVCIVHFIKKNKSKIKRKNETKQKTNMESCCGQKINYSLIRASGHLINDGVKSAGILWILPRFQSKI